ncbi:carbohydrate kinase family protein [Candidatus Pacearchaeota archaeon]|nr:carbohydrate kinase family protein [Candidatus Pacearchaeota archaeon]
MKEYDIISVGSAVVDAFVRTGVKEKNKEISFPLGDKILVNDLFFSIGGGGMNTSASFSKLGLKTGYLGKIGNDYNSILVLKELRENNVDFLGVKGRENNGYSVILEGTGGDRTVLTFKGVSDKLRFNEIPKSHLNTKWFHFTSQKADSLETQKKLVDYAVKNNITISFNPSSYQVKEGLGNIRKIVENSHIISMNKEEAEILAGKKESWKKIHNLGVKIVIITDGEKMGIVYDGNYLYKYWPDKIKAKEVTGAGDAFSAGFIAGYIRTRDIEMSIRVALANSQSVITKLGASEGILTWNQAQSIIKSKKFKIKREAV